MIRSVVLESIAACTHEHNVESPGKRLFSDKRISTTPAVRAQYRRPTDTTRQRAQLPRRDPNRLRLDHQRRRSRPFGALAAGASLRRQPAGSGLLPVRPCGSVSWPIDDASRRGRTTRKKGVFACNIDLLYDLISGRPSRAERCSEM